MAPRYQWALALALALGAILLGATLARPANPARTATALAPLSGELFTQAPWTDCRRCAQPHCHRTARMLP